jgi:hypothetical protein
MTTKLGSSSQLTVKALQNKCIFVVASQRVFIKIVRILQLVAAEKGRRGGEECHHLEYNFLNLRSTWAESKGLTVEEDSEIPL